MQLSYSETDAMSIEETEALIKGSPTSPGDSRLTPILRPRLRVYTRRFYILGSFALIGMCQCMNCFTLTSLPDSTEAYFGITQSELIVIFNWQPLANTVGALFASALYSTLGTKWTVRLLALFATAGAGLRCIPSLVPAVMASRDLTLLCLHISSIVNGCGGPILNAAPALIAAIWFPAAERMTATGILGTCPIFGSMIGFFMGPRVVRHHTDVPNLLYIEALATVVCGMMIWIYFPEKPPTPPSGVAELRTQSRAATTQGDFELFLRELPAAISTWPFLITCLSANTFLAIYGNAWQTIAPSMFVEAGYSEGSANSFLLITTVASVIGGFASGPLLKLFGGRLKLLECVALLTCVVGLGVLSALLPSPWWSAPLFASAEVGGDGGSAASESGSSSASNDNVAAIEIIVVGILCILGFGQGVSWPPLFELAAEMTYPISEATSGGFTGLTNNLGGVVFLYLVPVLPTGGRWGMNNLVTVLVSGCGVAAFVVFACVPVRLKRTDAEGRHLQKQAPVSTAGYSTADNSQHRRGIQ